MATFSFDIVSDYDKAEINNVFMAVEREITNRYDFKGTPAGIDWLDDKKGLVVTGNGDWQVEAVIDIVRKHLANRGLSAKVLDLSKPVAESNLKATKELPFVSGLDQTKAKQVTKLLKEQLPKLKTSIQGEAVRAQSGSKDELQKAMQLLNEADMDFPLSFTNYR